MRFRPIKKKSLLIESIHPLYILFSKLLAIKALDHEPDPDPQNWDNINNNAFLNFFPKT
jgi:hypothetical protein